MLYEYLSQAHDHYITCILASLRSSRPPNDSNFFRQFKINEVVFTVRKLFLVQTVSQTQVNDPFGESIREGLDMDDDDSEGGVSLSGDMGTINSFSNMATRRGQQTQSMMQTSIGATKTKGKRKMARMSTLEEIS